MLLKRKALIGKTDTTRFIRIDCRITTYWLEVKGMYFARRSCIRCLNKTNVQVHRDCITIKTKRGPLGLVCDRINNRIPNCTQPFMYLPERYGKKV